MNKVTTGGHNLAPQIVWLVVVLTISGCHRSVPAERVQFEKWVRSGFQPWHPLLYVSRDSPLDVGRMEALEARLDPACSPRPLDEEHTVDGRLIRFWNTTRSRAVVVSVDGESHTISTPAHCFVDMRGGPVAWTETDRSTDRWVFASGQHLYAPHLSVDATGEFFAYGGNYYTTATDQGGHMPIVVRAIQDPETDLAISSLNGVLDHIFVTEERIYVTAWCIGGSFWEPSRAACEIFRRDGSALTTERVVEVRAQTPIADFVRIADISPQQDRWLVYIHRCMPYQSSWALFAVDCGIMEPLLADPRTFVGFVRPELVERLLRETARDE